MNYLAKARVASHKHRINEISNLMEEAIDRRCLEEAHSIGVEFCSHISDVLVQKLAAAYLTTSMSRTSHHN